VLKRPKTKGSYVSNSEDGGHPRLPTRQVPTLTISFVIAELFYKFHSFTPSCAAFLVKWFVLDVAVPIVAPLGTAAPCRGMR
jgi:hypothetical protein